MKWLFLLLKAGKLGKVATTGGTMLLSIGAYAFVFGWRYAAGFVLLIFFHEMGHYLAAKQVGLKVGAPTFIPFVGAWIQLKDQPHNVETEAYVGIAGPVMGIIAAMACYYAARYFEAPLLLALSYSGLMINLFNLIPLSPLDGGRIVAIISPKIWWIGVPILVVLFFWRASPMLLMIVFLAIPHLWSTMKNDKESQIPEGYYNVSLKTRIGYGIYYLCFVAFLGIMVYEIHSGIIISK